LIAGLARAPEDRPRSAGALIADLAVALEQTPETGYERETVPLEREAAGRTAKRPTASAVATQRLTGTALTRRRVLLSLAGVAAAGAVVALIALTTGGGGETGGDHDTGGRAAPAQRLGSPLLDQAALGKTLPGGDRAKRETCIATGAGPTCTVAQRAVAEEKTTAPFDGVITRWRVRHAEGEVTLRVLRESGSRPVLVRSSKPERPSGAAVNAFETCLPMAKGDLIGISIARGGTYGVVFTSKATIYLWDSGAPTSRAHLQRVESVEILLDADVERPGACTPGRS
jgi:hypothetical protein